MGGEKGNHWTPKGATEHPSVQLWTQSGNSSYRQQQQQQNNHNNSLLSANTLLVVTTIRKSSFYPLVSKMRSQTCKHLSCFKFQKLSWRNKTCRNICNDDIHMHCNTTKIFRCCSTSLYHRHLKKGCYEMMWSVWKSHWITGHFGERCEHLPLVSFSCASNVSYISQLVQVTPVS